MTLRTYGAAMMAVLLLGACGGGEDTPGQPTAEERRKLDNIAAKQDAEGAETFDTSPDSLVPAEGAAVETNAAGNAAAAAPASGATANSATGNSAAPR